MFNEYDDVVIGGFIVALIWILLHKIFDGILVVCCCQKQVDSLRALAQSNRPLLVQIGEVYHIPWTEELDRADSLIHESATVSWYNFYALYDISNRSTCLISEICNKMVQLVAASAATERAWEQRQRNLEPEPADLPLPDWTATPPPSPPPSDVLPPSFSLSTQSKRKVDSTYPTFSNRLTPINWHLHLHSLSLPQNPKEEEHAEENPTSGGPEDKKNKKKKRGNKFVKREKEKENKGKKKFCKGKKRENWEEEEEMLPPHVHHKEEEERIAPLPHEEEMLPPHEHHKEEEERITPLPHEEEKKAPCEGKIEESASEEENLLLSSDEEPLQSVRPPISSPMVSLSNEEIPPQTLPSVISSPPRRRRGGIGG